MGSSDSRPTESSSSRQQWASNDKFSTISDNYKSLDEVKVALRKNGLESSSLIVAVDFTKSNEWSGAVSFQHRSLHWLGEEANPYEVAMSIIARTLQSFDDDGLIPAFGFGDATTGDAGVFHFFRGGIPAQGLEALAYRYRELAPHVKLAGPTSFAPAIYQAMRTVCDSGGQYHILVIIADGQVTRPTDTPPNYCSKQERETIDAIVNASELPLSIVMVGVGDGPWDVMREFDDRIPQRRWDNFQFVNFTEIAAAYSSMPQRMETIFALRTLMEIPEQYKIIQKLGLLGRRTARIAGIKVMDPPGPVSGYGAAVQPSVAPPQQANFVNPSPVAAAGPSLLPEPGNTSIQNPGSASMRALFTKGSSMLRESTPEGPPPMFICPITQEIMKDPVMAADGYSYDRSSITQWLQTHHTSPMTNTQLPHKTLTPNHALRSSIMEYLEETSRQP
ncbi:hypothetical protein CEUSTIGMA_g1299.t1 [Chlamydomonas eustigma]|uniref:U-box domain-containing protein n=1 Tax=Chlamydomonas eustigma TaxID=1157962 RepID=A0A250WT19_9CHLO|nr:hypothetical protein CEUSTIGMA_g1299.t1 [Chlamydomonas eustigma]|eukprot:GAX73849.1 hypothetical protein CEUSTIGMA_g1299.t1 [Chlamydomonas eustigma]